MPDWPISSGRPTIFGSFRFGMAAVHPSSMIFTMKIQNDGKIVCTGKSLSANFTGDLVAMRFNTTGSLDTNFGVGGYFKYLCPYRQGNSASVSSAMDIDATGKIIIVGSETLDATAYSGNKPLILRLKTNGTRDSSFLQNGLQNTQFAGSYRSIPESVIALANGKILVGGHIQSSPTYDEVMILVRYNANGTLDANFGTNGIRRLAYYTVGDELYGMK